MSKDKEPVSGYNQHWIVQRLDYLTPPKLDSNSLRLEPLHE